MKTRPPEPALRLAKGLVPLLGLATLLPFVSTAAGLLMGVAVALSVGNPWVATTKKLTTWLLQASIVGLGFALDLHAVLDVGLRGFLLTLVGIVFTLAVGLAIGRVMCMARDVCLLVAVGTAICGGSAIAAIAPILRAKDADVTVAMGVVFLLNAVGLLIFPPIGAALGLSPEAFGWWAALAIHDTSSVVGAASAYADGALGIATTAKLGRALWILPLAFVVGAWQRRRMGADAPDARPAPPWFVLGFVAAAALSTFVPGVREVGEHVAFVARRLLVLTLFLVGANLSLGALRAVGVRPLVHGVLLWVAAAGAGLIAILAGVVG